MKVIASKPLYAFALAAAGLIAAPAHAQLTFGRMDTGLYLGAGVGASRSEIDMTGVTGSTDETDTGGKLFAGYQFHRNVAVEIGYYDFGKATFDGNLNAAIPPFGIGTPTSGSFKTTAGAASLIGILPLQNDFSLLGRLGVSYSEQKVSASVGTATADAKAHTTQLTYGLGAQYSFTPNVGVRAEWERFRVGGNGVGGKNDIDLYTVNLLYRFR